MKFFDSRRPLNLIFKGVLGLHNKEKITYQIKGKVWLEAGALAPSVVPFTSNGELSFDDVVQSN